MNGLLDRIRCLSIVLLFHLFCQPAQAAQWVDLVPDAYAPTGVTQASISGDESSLYVFYREPDYGLNIDKGILKYLNNSRWVIKANLTNECHQPDIAIKGNQISAIWQDDSLDAYYAYTTADGTLMKSFYSLMRHQYGVSAAIAKGVPYTCFAALYDNNGPTTTMRLHVRNNRGEDQMLGGWGGPALKSIGSDPSMTGDDNYWYSVATYGGNVYVKKDWGFVGTEIPGFGAQNPRIVIYKGKPAVAFEASSRKYLLVYVWDGASWTNPIGYYSPDGMFSETRMAASDTDLYIVSKCSDDDPNIIVIKYDGSESFLLPSPTTVSSSSISTVDVTIFEGNLTVGFVENSTLKVRFYLQAQGVLTPGDVNGDTVIDIADAILAFKVAAGFSTGNGIYLGADVEGNGDIGLQEVLFVLQQVAGFRD